MRSVSNAEEAGKKWIMLRQARASGLSECVTRLRWQVLPRIQPRENRISHRLKGCCNERNITTPSIWSGAR